jgi:two-component system cell cycle response regulator
VMLHKGMGTELQPHLLALMRNLQPLLAMANQELNLDWDLSRLDE